MLVMRMSRKHNGHALCIEYTGTVDRRGYVSQQKGTIYDARGPCPSISRTMKPVFRRIRLICYAYESLRCLHLEIGDFCAHDDNNDNDTTDYFTPCACAQGNNSHKVGKADLTEKHFKLEYVTGFGKTLHMGSARDLRNARF